MSTPAGAGRAGLADADKPLRDHGNLAHKSIPENSGMCVCCIASFLSSRMLYVHRICLV